MKGVTAQLKKRENKQRDFITSIDEIENQFINELRNTKKPLAEQYQFGDLEEKYRRIVRNIYAEKDVAGLKGKDMKEFWERLTSFESSSK